MLPDEYPPLETDAGAAALRILPEMLPAASVGQNYEAALKAEGGTPPYRWRVSAGPQLRWLVVDDRGTLRSATKPDAIISAGARVQVEVVDELGARGSREYVLVVGCDPSVVIACFNPSADKRVCLQGQQRCVGGQLTPCESVGAAVPSTDFNRCGGNCGACSSVMANACKGGECSCGTQKACDGSQAGGGNACCGSGDAASCVSLQTSTQNCGSCGNNCAAANQVLARMNVVPGCSDSRCLYSCKDGFGNCDGTTPSVGNDSNGCERAIRNDVNNCGACNARCADQIGPRANIAATCTDATCVFACAAGFMNCNGPGGPNIGSDGDGCETPNNTVANCGACGRTCTAPPNATPICVNGGCDFVCNGNLLKCGNQCLNSQTDVNNCGKCGRSCQTGQWCAGGECCSRPCFPGDKPPCELVCY